jgi:phage major head subunit gpT-like protein
MIINSGNLRALQVGFKTSFQQGVAAVPALRSRIATEVPSSTASEQYPWLADMPGMREWIGERQLKNISEKGYEIKNRRWEDTVEVPRTTIEDDQYGVYSTLMAAMGRSSSEQPEQLVFSLLAAGFTTICYDGQYFFDTDHPVKDAAGIEQSVSNMQAGSGNPWFLFDTSRALKPLIFQNRKRADFVALDNPDDHNVFMRDRFIYGSDARNAAGFGFWQTAFGSKAALDKANFEAAYTAMMQFKRDGGQPLGIMPNLLVCGPSNMTKAREVVEVQRLASGADNPNFKLVEVLVVPWLV